MVFEHSLTNMLALDSCLIEVKELNTLPVSLFNCKNTNPTQSLWEFLSLELEP
jgi:hypothetical protein